jgi:hypothetical protein
MEDVKATIAKMVDDVAVPVLNDLKELVKKYGVWIIVTLFVIYLYKKVK